jgi:hypothetical protein
MSHPKKRSASFIDDSDTSSNATAQASKKTKKAGSLSPAGEDDDGNPYWDVRSFHTDGRPTLTFSSCQTNAELDFPSSKTCVW